MFKAVRRTEIEMSPMFRELRLIPHGGGGEETHDDEHEKKRSDCVQAVSFVDQLLLLTARSKLISSMSTSKASLKPLSKGAFPSKV